MTIYRNEGDALKAIKIVVTAEKIDRHFKRVKLTSDHTGEKTYAKGEAYAYIDIPYQSVPRRVRVS